MEKGADSVKLYDQNKKNIRNVMVNQQVDGEKRVTILLEVPKDNSTSSVELGSLETVDLNLITTYLVELYR